MSGRATDVARLVGAVAVLLALYVGLAAFVGRQLPSDAVVAGVHVGGMTEEAARERLALQLRDAESWPFTLMVAGRKHTFEAGRAGLHLDLDSTLEGATGFSLDPREVWRRLDGGGEYPLQGRVDAGPLYDTVAAIARRTDRPVVQGGIRFAGVTPRATRSVEGLTVDASATVQAVSEAWPAHRSAEAVVAVDRPAVAATEIDRLMAEVAKPAVSAPLQLVVGRRRRTIPVATYAPTLRMVPSGSTLALTFDGPALGVVVEKAFPGLVGESEDAGLRLVDGAPQVTPGRPDVSIRTDLTAANAASVLTRPAARRVAAVALAQKPPSRTAATVRGWKITRRVAGAQVAPVSGPAASNARRALDALDGAVVAPGERFSLDARIGPRTAEAGYADAPTGGEPSTALGGGVDQVASAAFEAFYRAGLATESRTPPPVHLPGTTPGLDAVLTGGDVAFTTAPDAAVFVTVTPGRAPWRIDVWAAQPAPTVVSVGPRLDVTPPGEPQTEISSTCRPDAGEPGFRVVVRRAPRTASGPAAVEHETVYRPRPGRVCLPLTPEPAPVPPPPPAPPPATPTSPPTPTSP